MRRHAAAGGREYDMKRSIQTVACRVWAVRSGVVAGACCAVLLLVAVSGGCTTQSVSSRDLGERSRFLTAIGGGEVKMSWQSRVDRKYTVLYADSRTQTEAVVWHPLPGSQGLRGTGGQMTAEDTVVQGRPRVYRLHSSPL